MGVFTGDGGKISRVAESASSDFASIDSHPDINTSGTLSFYARLQSGRQGVLLTRNGEEINLTGLGEPLKSLGPLGPTMNDEGTVAFRANLQSGAAGIFTGSRERIVTIAETGSVYSAFHGLPVISDKGTVVFRADLQGRGQGIYLARGASHETIVETGDRFSDLGLFPSMNDAGMVAFGATLKAGGAGIFAVINGRTQRLVDKAAPFESFRGVLINRAGLVVFYATPKRGGLGIYSGPDPIADRILSLGDPLFGSAVTEFALNPVSVNEAGQIAIRVGLADKRQAILRIDPVPTLR